MWVKAPSSRLLSKEVTAGFSLVTLGLKETDLFIFRGTLECKRHVLDLHGGCERREAKPVCLGARGSAEDNKFPLNGASRIMHGAETFPALPGRIVAPRARYHNALSLRSRCAGVAQAKIAVPRDTQSRYSPCN